MHFSTVLPITSSKETRSSAAPDRNPPRSDRGSASRPESHIYLEIHHIRSLADGGADHPPNVAAVCPNCHSHVTHGKDADDYNAVIAQNVKAVEAQLQSEAK
jgi:cytochrome c553